MTNEEREVLLVTTRTLYATRLELDGIRTVLVAACAVIGSEPHLGPKFAATLRAAKEAGTAASLNSSATDASIAAVEEWIRRLVPQDIADLLK